MARALALRMDASWSLLHHHFYDTLSGGHDNRLRDVRLSLHPTVVLNAFLLNEGPAGDASGGNSTWLGNEMRVIGAAGMSGRLLWPLVNMGGGGGGQMMLVAGRENVQFHGMPDQINPCLASEIGQSQFRIGRDEENGTILEEQRNTKVYLSATRSFERQLFFPGVPMPRRPVLLLLMA